MRPANCSSQNIQIIIQYTLPGKGDKPASSGKIFRVIRAITPVAVNVNSRLIQFAAPTERRAPPRPVGIQRQARVRPGRPPPLAPNRQGDGTLPKNKTQRRGERGDAQRDDKNSAFLRVLRVSALIWLFCFQPSPSAVKNPPSSILNHLSQPLTMFYNSFTMFFTNFLQRFPSVLQPFTIFYM